MTRRIPGLLALIILCLCPALSLSASAGESGLPEAIAPDSLRVSLVTCDAGPEIFELYGHQAIRISGRMEGQPLDVVYNYGMFDFDSPGFIYRFVKGATDYYAAAMPTGLFLYSYELRGSRVTEYPLILTPAETTRLLEILDHDTAPAYRTYRYKYFSNNCATRILDAVDAATGAPAVYPRTGQSLTYRDMLMHYDAGYPWYQLGIDLALGSRLDKEISPRERLFAPLSLADALAGAHRPDGTPLAGPPVILTPGRGDVRLSPTPWYLTPCFIFWVTGLLACGAILICRRRRRSCPLLVSLWGLAAGLAGCLLWFLVFLSEHEGTSPNFLAVWLNPFWLLAPIFAWSRRLRKPLAILLMLQGVAAAGGTLAALLCHQYINPALIPLILTTLAVCAAGAFPPERKNRRS